VAYVPNKAISAGALIAVACNEIVMGPTAFLGDCEPIFVSPTGEQQIQTAPEKIQTVLRARFRSYALRNGYPAALSEAMVTKGPEVLELSMKNGSKLYIQSQDLENLTDEQAEGVVSKRIVVRKGELLTMNTQEAVGFGFCKFVAKDVKELLAKRDLEGAAIMREETNWSEELSRFLDSISPVILAIGLLALYIGLFHMPGFGVPEIVGIACLAIVFVAKYTAGLAEAWEALLFIGGIGLLALEVFVIPGFGIIGILGLMLMAASLLMMFQGFYVPSTDWQWKVFEENVIILGLTGLGASVGALILGRFLPRVPVLGRLVLETANRQPLTTQEAPAPEVIASLIGQRGECLTTLRPSGKMRLGKQTYSVMTEGDYVEQGAEVEVVQIEGNRIIVRKIPET